MVANDQNFKVGPPHDVDEEQSNFVDDFKEEPLDSHGGPVDIDSLSGNSHSRNSSVPSLEQFPSQYATLTNPSNSPSPMQRPRLPVKVIPILFSLSDTSDE